MLQKEFDFRSFPCSFIAPAFSKWWKIQKVLFLMVRQGQQEDKKEPLKSSALSPSRLFM
jgi:hypothetical protein